MTPRHLAGLFFDWQFRIWTPPHCKQAVDGELKLDFERISGLLRWHTLMPGHNGLFARQFQIASTYFKYTELSGFDRRRFDLFAISWLALQSSVKCSCELETDYHAGIVMSGWYSVCRRNIAQAMRAVLLASAVAATFGCRLVARPVTHWLSRSSLCLAA